MFVEGTLGAVGRMEHGMMGCVGAGSKRCFQVSVGTVNPHLSLSLSLSSLVAMLQRPFELVPREVLPDGQL